MSANKPPAIRRRYLQGLKVAASGNSQAFGFSILITVSYGIVAASTPPPSRAEQIGFALAAVAAFTLLNLAVALLAQGESDAIGSKRVLLVTTATDFLAVGAGVGTAIGLDRLTNGLATWILTPFFAALIYMLVQAFELALGRIDADHS